MAIPVARVHLAMAHAALPGLLPSPPKCAMLPLLPAPPCATTIIVPNNSPPRPSRADVAERWDAHKTKQGGGSQAPPPPSSLDRKSNIPGKWVSSNTKSAADANAATFSSSSSSSSSGNDGRSDTEERWDAHKRPPATASTASSSSSLASRSKRRGGGGGGSNKRRPNSRASSSAERWDAHKNGRRVAPADKLDDGESSTGSNDVELDKQAALQRALYAGPGFIASPEPSMLPVPSFMIRVA
ncbi:unnamed protein product [Urochloa decumbens]|uniref:Uncharacterized protein n=1 Tax=Urochloa decumbens TaxID=240449 RepID=A0ABC9B1S6_9POAL